MHTDRARELDELADEIDAAASTLEAVESQLDGSPFDEAEEITATECGTARRMAEHAATRLRELAMDERTTPTPAVA